MEQEQLVPEGPLLLDSWSLGRNQFLFACVGTSSTEMSVYALVG